MSTLIFRRAETGDAGVLHEMLKQIGRFHAEGRPDLFRDDACKASEEEIRSILLCPDTPVFVAEKDGCVIAYAYLQYRMIKDHPVRRDTVEAFLDDFYVEESSRRQGIGNQLIRFAMAEAKNAGADTFLLNVYEFNRGAIDFYDRLGLTTRARYMECKL